MYYSAAPISIDNATAMVPALVAAPHASRSNRYEHIPTVSILRALEAEGFQIHGLTTSHVRDPSRRGHQKHLVRLRRPEHANADVAPEVILINSHDGTTSYKLLCGMIRFACANGIIAGDKWANYCVKHTGKHIVRDVIEGTFQVVDQFDRLTGAVDAMKQITLSRDEQVAFASAAQSLRYDDENPCPVPAERFLAARRVEDRGDDLWTTFNRVQENLIRGGQQSSRRDHPERKRRASVRAVNGIDANVKLNQALFTLAESMATLRAA